MKARALLNKRRIPTYFWLLANVAVLTICMYIFFVQSSVYYLLSAHEIGLVKQSESHFLSSLESEYFKLSSVFTLPYATDQGFVNTPPPIFARVSEQGALVGLNTNDTGR